MNIAGGHSCKMDGHKELDRYGRCSYCHVYPKPASTAAKPTTPRAKRDSNPYMRNDRTRPCTRCHSYCDGDCYYR